MLSAAFIKIISIEWMDEIKDLFFFTNFLLIWLDDRARRSPRKLPTSLKKGERKWAPPKFLPHKYDVKLQNEDKVSWHLILNLLHVVNVTSENIGLVFLETVCKKVMNVFLQQILRGFLVFVIMTLN